MTLALRSPDRQRRALVVSAGALAWASSAAWAKGRAATHTVVMEATAYAPLALHVRRGDRVVWINRDPFPHTVTCKGVFDSGSVEADGQWLYRANVAGRFDYVCVFHPNMKATLLVS